MIGKVFLRQCPSFEEILCWVAICLFGKGENKATEAELYFLTPNGDLPDLGKKKLSNSVFIGVAGRFGEKLEAAGVTKEQMIDADSENSLSQNLLKRLGLEGDEKLARWVNILKTGGSLLVHRTITAMYDMEVNDSASVVNWVGKLVKEALTDDEYFVKGRRVREAGIFFERAACVWAGTTIGEGERVETTREFFFDGWQNRQASFEKTITDGLCLTEKESQTLAEIKKLVKNGCEEALHPLGLPRLTHSFCLKKGVGEAISAVSEALDAEKSRQKTFLAAIKEAESALKIKLPNRTSFVVFTNSLNRYIVTATFCRYPNEAAAVVRKDGDGYVGIFSNGNHNAYFDLSLSLEINKEERRCNGKGEWSFSKNGNKNEKLQNVAAATAISKGWLEKTVPALIAVWQEKPTLSLYRKNEEAPRKLIKKTA